MKKQELESGMYVKLRDESMCIVQVEEDLLIDVKDGTYTNLKHYNDNLTQANNIDRLDIVVVYYNYKLENILWEESKELLTKEEKEYLKAVIKPFKDVVKYVIKLSIDIGKLYIEIVVEKGIDLMLPYINYMSLKFEGLEINKKYTLKELGLDD